MTSARSVPAVKLGDELSVSAIGFGAMALTPVYGEVDDTESLATLHRAVDLGVTFIDTAGLSIRSAKTVSMMACWRWAMSAAQRLGRGILRTDTGDVVRTRR